MYPNAICNLLENLQKVKDIYTATRIISYKKITIKRNGKYLCVAKLIGIIITNLLKEF